MLQSSSKQIIEKDFDASKDPVDKYFGVGWTKVYVEKMLSFYSKLNPSKNIQLFVTLIFSENLINLI